jgi:hypothetical protein
MYLIFFNGLKSNCRARKMHMGGTDTGWNPKFVIKALKMYWFVYLHGNLQKLFLDIWFYKL